MSPKERFGYGGLVAAGLAICGFIGAKQLNASPPPELKLEPAIQGKSGIAEPSSSEVVVHVVGAVKKPGLIRLEPGERVADAIAACGGHTSKADLNGLNLAAKLVDGSQLEVPVKGAPPAVEEAYKPGSHPDYKPKLSKSTSRAASASPGSVSLNSATMAQLDTLPGVGPSTAQKILDYRQTHGGFSSIDELLSVKGIGPKKLAAMRKFLRL